MASCMLQMILGKLEDSVSKQTAVEQSVPAETVSMDEDEGATDVQQPQTDIDEEMIREFLSAKNLKTVRNDSSRKSSSCFGRRLDRIGSMSSLGCNTVGKYSKLHKLSLQTELVWLIETQTVSHCTIITKGLNLTDKCFLLFSHRSKVKMKSYHLKCGTATSLPKDIFISKLFIY